MDLVISQEPPQMVTVLAAPSAWCRFCGSQGGTGAGKAFAVEPGEGRL